MSRRPGAVLVALLVALLGTVFVSAPLAAQDAPPATADEAVAAAREAYGPPASRKAECALPKPGEEIVVCGEEQDNSAFRVKSSGELDPTGKGAKDNVPRAPDVGTVYPGVVVARGCFIPPCPPPMPVLIDLKAIPEAPPGSDADRVGQGLAPRGGSGEVPLPGTRLPGAIALPPEAEPTPEGSASPAAAPSG